MARDQSKELFTDKSSAAAVNTLVMSAIQGITLNDPPIYLLLFLNCVAELLLQVPQAFEFSEHYLICLMDEYYSSG